MSRIDTPAQLEHHIDRVQLLLLRIRNDYRWLHGFAFGAPGSSRAGEGHNPGKPDPTGNAVGNEHLDRARDDLRAVIGDVESMINSLGNAAKTLRRYDYTRREVLALRETDRVASDADVLEAKEMQAKRMADGRGWGAA